ncbi:MAG: DUF3078 domain-containing protein [Rikenellaceae bacterium]
MRRYTKIILLFSILLALPATVSAQMTIDKMETTKTSNVKFRDSVKLAALGEVEYYSEARDRAERAALRKERNTLEIISSLQGSMTSYNDTWIENSGGDNTTAILSSFTLNHTFKKDKLTVVSKVAASLGFNRIKIDTGTDDEGNTINEGVWFKNQDALSITVTPTISISSVWSYGPSISFRTQFANGYVSRSQQEGYQLKSGFMAPGYLDISGVMKYTSSNKTLPITVSIAPVALSAVYVSKQAIIDNYCYSFADHSTGTWAYTELYGLSPYVKSKYEGGSSIQIDYDKTFTKLNSIRYTTKIYSFYGWMTQLSYKNIVNDYDTYVDALAEWNTTSEGVKPILGIQPTVLWENTISIPTTKLLSTTIKYQLYYNRAQDLKVQTQTYLSVGLSYTYKNK